MAIFQKIWKRSRPDFAHVEYCAGSDQSHVHALVQSRTRFQLMQPSQVMERTTFDEVIASHGYV